MIAKNLAKTSLQNAEVRKASVDLFAKRLGPATKFDLIFADPPYARDEETAELLADLLNLKNSPNASSRTACLFSKRLPVIRFLKHRFGQCKKRKTYGDTRISFLVRT